MKWSIPNKIMIPKLQLALDMLDLSSAMKVTQQVQEYIDVIEVGTLLCLSEGMKAIRDLSAAFPNKTIVGDVRIVRAGRNIAEMAFQAGAHWITVVSETPLATIAATIDVAKKYNGQIQLELGEHWDPQMAQKWRELGIEQLIYHSTNEVTEVDGYIWSQPALNQIQEMTEMGFKVTVTGGIKPNVISRFVGIPVFILIAGRAIWQADSPRQVALELRETITKNFKGAVS